MPTNAKTKSKRAAARKSRRDEPGSAIALLKEDHREVEEFFEEYEDLDNENDKAELAEKICMALKVHTQLEEEIFYPQARKATGDNDLLDEALVEHAGAKHLIEEIEAMDVGDDLYDAKIRVLGEQIRHHVKEEEEELFPEIERSKMDVVKVGEQLAERKAELMAGVAE
ncbi:MAG: hemerythrin domain-containing protein [Alphaproteobacteria bacterium]|nr:hemerythrin domain-containing protein [Alphaproteobacteria bacterium]